MNKVLSKEAKVFETCLRFFAGLLFKWIDYYVESQPNDEEVNRVTSAVINYARGNVQSCIDEAA